MLWTRLARTGRRDQSHHPGPPVHELEQVHTRYEGPSGDRKSDHDRLPEGGRQHMTVMLEVRYTDTCLTKTPVSDLRAISDSRAISQSTSQANDGNLIRHSSPVGLRVREATRELQPQIPGPFES